MISNAENTARPAEKIMADFEKFIGVFSVLKLEVLRLVHNFCF